MGVPIYKIFKYPRWISWEVTNACNFRCIHCRMDEDFLPGNELSYDESINCIDQFHKLGIDWINFSGGEPFLRKDFISLLEYASNLDIKVGITSNGSLITNEIAERLKNIKNLETIQISIDGKDAETHDRIRGIDGAFDSAVNAIKLLLDSGIRTGAVTTVMKPNIRQIPDIVQLLMDLGINVYGARRFMPTGKGDKMRNDLLVTAEEYKEHCEYWAFCMKEFGDKMQFIIEEPLLGIIKDKLPEYWNTTGCQAGVIYGAMTFDGDIRPCIFLPLSMGNIRNQSFDKIWSDSEMRKKIAYRELNGKCNGCSVKNECGGCRAMAYFQHGDFLEEDAMCFLNA